MICGQVRFVGLCALALGLGVMAVSAQVGTVEERVSRHAVKLAGDSDFAAIDKAVKDKRIVILGEAGHSDGRSFEIRTRMIFHLIEDLGFDALVLEGAGPLSSITVKSDFAQVWMPAWANVKECQPLIEAVNSGRVPVFGMDPTVDPYTALSLQYFMTAVDPEFASGIDWERLNDINYSLYLRHLPEMDPEDEAFLIDLLPRVKNHCNKLLAQGNGDKKSLKLMLLGLDNFVNAFADFKIPRVKPEVEIPEDYEMLIVGNNLRDFQMAANLEWYLQQNPDHKVVVWCANFHGARDLSQCEFPRDPSSYIRTRILGEHLARKYGDELYSIAFVDPGPAKGELCMENYLAEKMDYGFIDFTPLRYSEEFFGKPFYANALRRKQALWMNMFDGIYFLSEQKRSTWLQ